MIIGDTLYRRGIDTVLRRCLTHEEAEKFLNGCHSGLSHDSSAPYYLQSNRQVEAINKVSKRMLQRMIGVYKWSWYLILYSALWAYRKLVRNATGFTPFQLVYVLEAVLLVQCEISSVKLAVDLLPETLEEEARFLELIQLDENYCDAALANEAHKK
eukprot:PITA_31214